MAASACCCVPRVSFLGRLGWPGPGQVGGRMDVKVLSLKDNRGKIRLSRRAALQDAALAAATMGVTPPAA